MSGLSHEERGSLRRTRHGNFVHLETAVEAIVAAHTADLAAQVAAPMSLGENVQIRAAFERDRWAGEWNGLPTAIDRLLANRTALSPAQPDGERGGVA